MELRVPWALLNFSNPAKGMVHDDYYEKYGVENLKIKEIYIGVGVQGQDTRIFMESVTLRPWEARTTYHQRLKPAYDVLRELWTNPVE